MTFCNGIIIFAVSPDTLYVFESPINKALKQWTDKNIAETRRPGLKSHDLEFGLIHGIEWNSSYGSAEPF